MGDQPQRPNLLIINLRYKPNQLFRCTELNRFVVVRSRISKLNLDTAARSNKSAHNTLTFLAVDSVLDHLGIIPQFL